MPVVVIKLLLDTVLCSRGGDKQKLRNGCDSTPHFVRISVAIVYIGTMVPGKTSDVAVKYRGSLTSTHHIESLYW